MMLIDNIMANIDFLQHFTNEYETLISGIGIFLAITLLIRIRLNRRANPQNSNSQTFNSNDMEMISGDDVVTTQLDLARAYIEMGKNNLAKSILHHVRKQGKPEQRQEARKLINSL